MEKMRLGRTGLMVSRSGFGALPIHRISFDESRELLLKAYESGINYFDTARQYSDSEEKIGYALSGVRENIIIATKSHAEDKKTLFEHLETSLKNLKTDYIDIYQLHNPATLPDPNDPDGLYAGMLEAKRNGLIRHIGITNHSIKNAIDAAESGLYETVQFPLNSLASDEDLKLVGICRQLDIGVVAMKAMSGGLITNPATTFAFLRQYDNVIPIWGLQKVSELEDFIALENNPPILDESMWEIINRDRAELAGDFCRGCGYCLPCPAGIDIPNQARISLMMNRSPYAEYLEDGYRDKMELIKNCINCGHCRDNCPYGLDTPNLLKRELKKYYEFYEAHKL
ncbi:MAG TPA: aldo/keto reductase [Clostridiaceae bacterium]|nr:aldo/keto reductase [Clostridiaceae bacterium]